MAGMERNWQLSPLIQNIFHGKFFGEKKKRWHAQNINVTETFSNQAQMGMMSTGVFKISLGNRTAATVVGLCPTAKFILLILSVCFSWCSAKVCPFVSLLNMPVSLCTTQCLPSWELLPSIMYSLFIVTTLLTNLIMAVGEKCLNKKVKIITCILSLISHSSWEVLSHLNSQDPQSDTAAFQTQEANQHLMKPGTVSYSVGDDTL